MRRREEEGVRNEMERMKKRHGVEEQECNTRSSITKETACTLTISRIIQNITKTTLQTTTHSKYSHACTLPSPVTLPTALTGQFSLSPMAMTMDRFSGATRNALFSWYSAPQICTKGEEEGGGERGDGRRGRRRSEEEMEKEKGRRKRDE